MSSKYFTVKAGGTYLANDVSLNKEITVDALGLLMVMLAMHPEAPKNRDSLCGRGLGRRRVAEALRCLERVGLRYRFRVSSTTGEWRTITILFDRPHSLEDAQLLARERVAEMNEGRFRSR